MTDFFPSRLRQASPPLFFTFCGFTVFNATEQIAIHQKTKAAAAEVNFTVKRAKNDLRAGAAAKFGHGTEQSRVVVQEDWVMNRSITFHMQTGGRL